jgi:hypothetical protein
MQCQSTDLQESLLSVLECPVTNLPLSMECDWNGNYSEVKNHLMKEHLEMCLDYGEGESRHVLSLLLDVSFYKFVFVYDEIFCCQFCERNAMIYVVVEYIGPAENAAKYKYKVEFVDKNETQGITVKHLTRSFLEHVRDKFESGNCWKLPYDMVSRLKSEENYITFKLEILRFGN